MLVLDCPSCGSNLQLPEGFTGKMVRCAYCQAVVTAPTAQAITAEIPPTAIPASTAVTAEGPHGGNAAVGDTDFYYDVTVGTARFWFGGSRRNVLVVLPCLFVFGLVLIIFPPVRKWLGPVTRAQAMNNLKQIAVNGDKDFARLADDESDQLLKSITRLLPHRTYRGFFDYRPWHVWEFGKNAGIPVYLLFEANDSSPHPSSTGIRLTLLEEPGKVLVESEFRTGHRLYLQSAELADAKGEENLVIALKTCPLGGPGPGDEKQYYARFGERFDLVMLEDHDGKAMRNRYYVKHFRCGPEAPKRTVADWQADLLSGSRLTMLRTLVLLGGTHFDLGGADKENSQYEEAADVHLVRQIRADQKVRTQLAALAKSEDSWLREAAVLALSPEDTHWGR